MTTNDSAVLAWHFVGATLRDGRPVPADGEWLVHDGPVAICESGLHASLDPFDALQYAPGAILCLVECDDVVAQRADKLVCRRRRIIKRRDATELLWEMSRWSALRVMQLWDAPLVVKRFLETGDDSLRAAASDAARAAASDAARAAASAAARDAARAAARAAASDAARAAARAAAWDAAWDAARDAARAAARAAAWAAAWDAAWDAVRAAARAAARDAASDAVRAAARAAASAAASDAASDAVRAAASAAAWDAQRAEFNHRVRELFQ